MTGGSCGPIRDIGDFHGIRYGTYIYLYVKCLHTNIRTALSSSSDLRGSTQPRLWKAICL
jgi:hypothetical protein